MLRIYNTSRQNINADEDIVDIGFNRAVVVSTPGCQLLGITALTRCGDQVGVIGNDTVGLIDAVNGPYTPTAHATESPRTPGVMRIRKLLERMF